MRDYERAKSADGLHLLKFAGGIGVKYSRSATALFFCLIGYDFSSFRSTVCRMPPLR
jgi:hypothetical protein